MPTYMYFCLLFSCIQIAVFVTAIYMSDLLPHFQYFSVMSLAVFFTYVFFPVVHSMDTGRPLDTGESSRILRAREVKRLQDQIKGQKLQIGLQLYLNFSKKCFQEDASHSLYVCSKLQIWHYLYCGSSSVSLEAA